MTGDFRDNYKNVRLAQLAGCEWAEEARLTSRRNESIMMRRELFLSRFQRFPQTRTRDQANRPIRLLMRDHRQIADITRSKAFENNKQILVRKSRGNFAGHDLLY